MRKHHHHFDTTRHDDDHDFVYPDDDGSKDDHDHGTLHHHHGAGDNDILIHDHPPIIDNDKHGHDIIDFDYDGSCYEFHYGPADHNHDDELATDNIATAHYYRNPNNKPATGYIDNTLRPVHDNTVDWADNLDNTTGSDPYNHLP